MTTTPTLHTECLTSGDILMNYILDNINFMNDQVYYMNVTAFTNEMIKQFNEAKFDNETFKSSSFITKQGAYELFVRNEVKRFDEFPSVYQLYNNHFRYYIPGFLPERIIGNITFIPLLKRSDDMMLVHIESITTEDSNGISLTTKTKMFADASMRYLTYPTVAVMKDNKHFTINDDGVYTWSINDEQKHR